MMGDVILLVIGVVGFLVLVIGLALDIGAAWQRRPRAELPAGRPSMTPEERAHAAMGHWVGLSYPADLERRVAAAIREAIDAETDACAAAIEQAPNGKDYHSCEYDCCADHVAPRLAHALRQRAAARREAEARP